MKFGPLRWGKGRGRVAASTHLLQAGGMETMSGQITRWDFAFLRSTTLLLFSALLIGPSLSYVVFGVLAVSFLVVWGKSPGARRWMKETLSSGRWVFFGLVLYSVLFLASTWFGAGFEARNMSDLTWLLQIVVFLIPASLALTPERPSRVEFACLAVFLFLVAFSLVPSLFQFLTGVNFFREWLGEDGAYCGNRGSGMLRNPIPYSQVLGVIFWFFAVAVLVLVKNRGSRVAIAISILFTLLTLGGIVITQSRGTWLAVAITGAMSVFLVSGRLRRSWIGIMTLATVFGVAWLAIDGGLRQRFESSFDAAESSNHVRLNLWRANWEIIKEHPLGIGYGMNDLVIEDAFEKLNLEKPDAIGHAHNEYIEVLVGVGWSGLIVLLLVSLWLLQLTLENRKRAAEAKHWWAEYLFQCSALVQVFIAVCILTDQLNNPMKFVLCFLWAMTLAYRPAVRAYREEDGASEEAPVGGLRRE